MARFTNERAYDDLISTEALNAGLQPALIAAVIGHESQFNPAATRQEPAINDASVGLMQVLYGTAKARGYAGPMGSPSDLSGLYDPATNIHYGTLELAHRLSQTDSVASAVSAYNGGYRPALGFGAPATTPVTVCLARDQVTGQCVQMRQVPVGEYANQPYVDDVLSLLSYFQGVWAAGPATDQAGSVSLTGLGAVWLLPVLGLAGLWYLYRRGK